MSEFYHIFVRPKPGVNRAQIEEKLNLGLDWFRYDDRSWVVKTTSDAKKWYSRLESLVEPGGNLFICRLDLSDYWGFMPQNLWDWIKEKSGKIPPS